MAEEDFFAPPPFDPAQAMQSLTRQLRELRLVERAGAFELKGQAIARLQPAANSIDAELVKRPARTPEWTRHTLNNSADVRRFVELVKRQLAGWTDD